MDIQNLYLFADVAGNIVINVDFGNAPHPSHLPPCRMLLSTSPEVIGIPVGPNAHLVSAEIEELMEQVIKFVDEKVPENLKVLVLMEARESIGFCCLRRWLAEQVRTKGHRTDVHPISTQNSICVLDNRIFSSKCGNILHLRMCAMFELDAMPYLDNVLQTTDGLILPAAVLVEAWHSVVFSVACIGKKKRLVELLSNPQDPMRRLFPTGSGPGEEL